MSDETKCHDCDRPECTVGYHDPMTCPCEPGPCAKCVAYYECIKNEVDWRERALAAERHVDNLLARIFRDGGQHAVTFPTLAYAVAAADLVAADLIASGDEARAALAEAQQAISEFAVERGEWRDRMAKITARCSGLEQLVAVREKFAEWATRVGSPPTGALASAKPPDPPPGNLLAAIDMTRKALADAGIVVDAAKWLAENEAEHACEHGTQHCLAADPHLREDCWDGRPFTCETRTP